MRQINSLPARHPTLGYKPYTSTHLHGSPSLPQYDGYANDITNPGQFKDYHYPNTHEASTLWYHDHGVHITAPNAYMGLAAFYLIHDERERDLPIPKGRYDVPLMVKDAIFANSGDLLFDDNSESGLHGDVILVNGKPWPVMRVERRKYRFRILNASLSRSYEWALDTGEPLTVIATDGGLIPAPQQVASFRHGMAERYSVVIDFAKYRIGQRVILRNLGPENNINFDTTGVVMAFDIVSESTEPANNEVPNVLNPDNPVMALQPSQPRPRACSSSSAAAVPVAGQRPDLGRRRQQRLQARARQPRSRTTSRSGSSQPLRRLVPPHPHPPDRLQDPRPQRPAAVRLRDRSQGHRLRGR